MEITANALQTVLTNQNVLFTDETVRGNCSIVHRVGSGLVTLRGLPNGQCRSRFRVSFGANVAGSTGYVVGTPLSLAIAIDGEGVAETTMTSMPAAAARFNNVFSSVFLEVPTGCCAQISVKNTGTTAIDVENANLIIERVA